MISSTYLLLDDIRNHMKEEFAGILFRAPIENGMPCTSAGEKKHCELRFYIGQLPPKRNSEEQGEDVPYGLVKCLGGEVTGEQTREYRVDVCLIFAVFVPENNPEAGFQELMNVAEHAMWSICFRRFWANDTFVHAPPIKMVHGTGKADSPYFSGLQAQGPYYMAAVTTQFKAAALPQKPPKNIVDAV